MNRNYPRRGFTIVELLVVIGIIILLAGISIPMALRAYRGSEITRVRMDMQTITTALEAYRQDHGDYPRVADVYDSGEADDTKKFHRGAIVLARALVAPGPVSLDGADGPGFRTRGTAGTVYGPYIKPEAFRISDDPHNRSAGVTDHEKPLLMDKVGRPVLYFPARQPKPNINVGQGFIADRQNVDDPRPLYNWRDNTPKSASSPPVLELEHNIMRRMLGDANPTNGRIDPGETAKYTGPFILWSAGADGKFGTDDDITNFDE